MVKTKIESIKCPSGWKIALIDNKGKKVPVFTFGALSFEVTKTIGSNDNGMYKEILRQEKDVKKRHNLANELRDCLESDKSSIDSTSKSEMDTSTSTSSASTSTKKRQVSAVTEKRSISKVAKVSGCTKENAGGSYKLVKGTTSSTSAPAASKKTNPTPKPKAVVSTSSSSSTATTSNKPKYSIDDVKDIKCPSGWKINLNELKLKGSFAPVLTLVEGDLKILNFDRKELDRVLAKKKLDETKRATIFKELSKCWAMAKACAANATHYGITKPKPKPKAKPVAVDTPTEVTGVKLAPKPERDPALPAWMHA